MKFISKHIISIVLGAFFSLFVFSNNIHAQKKTVLYIIPVDAAGRNSILTDQLIIEVKDSIDARKKLIQLIDKWIANGYLSIGVDSLVFEKQLIKAFVYFGHQYFCDSLQIENLPDGMVYKTENSPRSSVNKVFNLKSYLTLRNDILIFYENNGYPFARVYIDSAGIGNNFIVGKLIVDKKQLVKIDSVILKGNPKISRKYLQHYLQIKSGKLYNQGKINELSKLINDLTYIEQVKTAELEFRKNEADIYLYLKNKPSNFFSGLIGFASGSEEKPDFQITGDINLSLTNSFKIGDKIDFYWNKYNANSQNLKIGFQLPYLLFIPIGIDFHFGLEKSDIDYLNTDLFGAAEYSISASQKISAYFSIKKSYLFDNEAVVEDKYSGFSRNTAGLRFFLNKTDYLYNPRKGFLVDLSSGYGSRSTNASNTASIAETGLKADWYIRIGKISSLALLNKSSAIFSNCDFYENEMAKIGGINTLRGFDELSILASSYTIFTIEPRLIIGKNSSVYLFSDFAWYTARLVEGNITDFPLGFGLGINLDTKAGIFKLNFALGKQFDNPVKISESKLHFGFLARF